VATANAEHNASTIFRVPTRCAGIAPLLTVADAGALRSIGLGWHRTRYRPRRSRRSPTTSPQRGETAAAVTQHRPRAWGRRCGEPLCGLRACADAPGVKEGGQCGEHFPGAFLDEEMASIETMSPDVGGIFAPYLDRVIQRADRATRAPQQKHRAPDQAIKRSSDHDRPHRARGRSTPRRSSWTIRTARSFISGGTALWADLSLP
jgi:hypothetical protein